MPTNWKNELATRLAHLNAIVGMPKDLPKANAITIASTVAPPGSGDRPGAVCVVNISSEYVPGFCTAGSNGYLNAYDLVRLAINPNAVSATRARVDAALSAVVGQPASDIYFVAAELNGTGIRFYGDLCLVLKPMDSHDKLVILETNSYDLVREPRSAVTRTSADLETEARKIKGEWGGDLPPMAAIKIFAHRQGLRRLTTGQISDALLDDEDYIEGLRIGSFSVVDIKEARLSAAGVAQDGRIDERVRHGPAPDAASLKWRDQRRQAERALVAHHVPVRVVSTTGRTRS